MPRNFQAKKAIREKIWIKLALFGTSGSGKTYSSLRIITGMLNKLKDFDIAGNGKAIMFNTEGSRGLYYSDEFDYDIIDLDPPYTPELFIDAIDYAIDEKYPIIIFDSLSHEYSGEGGLLEIVEKGGGFPRGWAKASPRHRKLIERIVKSPIHVVANMRGKDQWDMSTDENGKLSSTKVALGPDQKKESEYEFTAALLLDQSTNTAQSTKDNTHLFEGSISKLLDEKDGEMLIEWANSGEGKFEQPDRKRTRTELANYAKIIGLKPIDIKAAFDAEGIEFDEDPEQWDNMTSALDKYAQNMKKEKGE